MIESECTNGVYTEDSIKKCKCITDIRCKYCDESNKSYERCAICNIENGYYPKIDEEDIDSYTNYYKNSGNF